MISARLRAFLILGLIAGLAIAAAAGLLLAVAGGSPRPLPPRAAADRPVLLLLTSLPLVFGEQFSLEGGGSPALSQLETRYKVVPISVASPAELAKGRLLLMAHPLAQPAEDLVALDSWVRGGGRLLLLADPMVEWPSERPLGDPLRPVPMFMDTGLLGHWGLRLDAPDERGPQRGELAGFGIVTVSPGALTGRCPTAAAGLVAHCRIGRGRATVVADADWLDVDRLEGAGHNLDALLAELARLEKQ
jgi:hypothetical protein